MPTDIGTGTTITFADYTFAEVLSVDWSASRDSVNTSHMLSTNAQSHIPVDLYDPGELSVELHLDNPGANFPVWSTATACTVTFPDSDTWSASAFVTGFDASIPLEDKMTATVKLKLTGEVTTATS